MKRNLIMILCLFICMAALAQNESDFVFDGNGTITGYTGQSTELVIPAYISGISVAAIGNRAFMGRGLTSVVIPSGVTSIGEEAFSYNQLTSVFIPYGVTAIRAGAFMDNQLRLVSIPASVTFIGDSAFRDNLLTAITIPDSVVFLRADVFRDNPLRRVTIGANTTLGRNMFFGIGFFDVFYRTNGRRAGTYTMDRFGRWSMLVDRGGGAAVLPAEMPQSNFAAEIADINGLWISEWSYTALERMTGEEREQRMMPFLSQFSWGEGRTLWHSSVIDPTTGVPEMTLEIDVTTRSPYIIAGAAVFGGFHVTHTAQAGASSIKANTIRGMPDPHEPDNNFWMGPEVDFIFHFIDSDTFWIESDHLGRLRSVLWRRLSEPAQ